MEVIHRLLRQGHRLAFDPDVVVHHARVSAERRLATRLSYGFGMGAYLGLWLREDRWTYRVLARWTLERVLNSLKAVRRRDVSRLREERLLLRGLAGGLRYGWRLRDPVHSPGER